MDHITIVIYVYVEAYQLLHVLKYVLEDRDLPKFLDLCNCQFAIVYLQFQFAIAYLLALDGLAAIFRR